VKCGFSIDHVSSNDDSAVKLNEDEEDEWHSLQPLGVQSEDDTQHVTVLSRSVESRVLTGC
jgi:hypothetical protein